MYNENSWKVQLNYLFVYFGEIFNVKQSKCWYFSDVTCQSRGVFSIESSILVFPLMREIQ